MSTTRKPKYEDIRFIALKLYARSKRASMKQTPSDAELKLYGFWRKAREILEGKRKLPKYVRMEILGQDKNITCPSCGKRLPSSSLVMECENCHKIGCPSCLEIRTYVETKWGWELFMNLKMRKEASSIKLRNMPRKKLCKDCVYTLDEKY